jgi:hypothetical protein
MGREKRVCSILTKERAFFSMRDNTRGKAFRQGLGPCPCCKRLAIL